MGYVPAAEATPETKLVVDVRGRPKQAHVVKKPIYVKEGS
jgi:glycine cleavage system aminomethyltransferase T